MVEKEHGQGLWMIYLTLCREVKVRLGWLDRAGRNKAQAFDTLEAAKLQSL